MTCTANTGSLALFTDSDLIRLTLEGEPDGFTVLMHRHLGAIKRRIGFMLQGDGVTEDLTQEVVLKAWRFLSTFRADADSDDVDQSFRSDGDQRGAKRREAFSV